MDYAKNSKISRSAAEDFETGMPSLVFVISSSKQITPIMYAY